jgi:hypothetical protein
MEKDGKVYEVKKEKVFLNGEDVTASLSAEEKEVILTKATAISKKMKMQEKAEKAQKKHERLKKKGKLSPVDEGKWLEKIEKLTEKLETAQKRVKRG